MSKVKITILAMLCAPLLFAQTQPSVTRELNGRVVEVTNGKSVGVPNVKVFIRDYSYDITQADGSFKLTLPTDRDYVTIELENTPEKMIAPPSGLVNVPPDRDLEIILCGEQNQKLMQQVNALDGRLKKLEKEKKLSQRQLLEMHRTLLDTIIHFQNTIANLERQSKETKEVLDAEIRAKDARIRALEDSVSTLVQALSKALEERFLKQKEHFDQISSDLLEYADRVKDLRNRLTPDRLPNYFKSSGAMAELNRTTAAYNEMRENILRTNKGNVIAVQQYWENPDAAEHLQNTYSYLLKNVHEEHVLPLHKEVVSPIQDYAGKQTGRTSAQKDSKKAAEEKLPGLSASILELEKKIQTVINTLSKNI